MDISDAEKKLRIVMANALLTIVRKYYDTIHTIVVSLNESDARRAELLAAAAVSLAGEYRVFFERYYECYVSALNPSGGNPYSGTAEWERRHARDFAVWITQTARDEPNLALSDAHIVSVIRTEVNAISNLAVLDSMFRGGQRMKRWKAFGDGKVRPTHRSADGQTVPIDEPFTVGGYRMMFPQDSSMGAPSEEIVNCRCTMTAD
jgi:hypothetical protein